MTVSRDDHMDTLLAQALGWVDPATRAVTPAIHPATTYVRDHSGGNAKTYSYSRDDNPTYAQVEAVLAALEGGAEAMVLSAGLSAASLPFLTLAPGDHVVLQDVIYWGVRKWVTGFAARHGIEVDRFSAAEPGRLATMLRPGQTKVGRNPGQPDLEVVDIAAAAAAAHRAGARLAVVDRRHAGSDAPVGTWRRSGDARRDQIPERPQRRVGRCPGGQGRGQRLVARDASNPPISGLVLAWLLRGMRLYMRQVSANALARPATCKARRR